jgi:hypothetical protein
VVLSDNGLREDVRRYWLDMGFEPSVDSACLDGLIVQARAEGHWPVPDHPTARDGNGTSYIEQRTVAAWDALSYARDQHLLPCGPFLRAVEPVPTKNYPDHLCLGPDDSLPSSAQMISHARAWADLDQNPSDDDMETGMHLWALHWPLPVSRASISSFVSETEWPAGQPEPEPLVEGPNPLYAGLWIERRTPEGLVRLLGLVSLEPDGYDDFRQPLWTLRPHVRIAPSDASPVKSYFDSVPRRSRSALYREAARLTRWVRDVPVGTGSPPGSHGSLATVRPQYREFVKVAMSRSGKPINKIRARDVVRACRFMGIGEIAVSTVELWWRTRALPRPDKLDDRGPL